MMTKTQGPQQIKDIAQAYSNNPQRLLDMLWDLQNTEGFVSKPNMDLLAEAIGVSPAFVEEVRSFYHFFLAEPGGAFQIYLDSSIVADLLGGQTIKTDFETQLKISVGQTTPDKMFSLHSTPCIGLSDFAPAALINFVPFVCLTTEKVSLIVEALKQGANLETLAAQLNPLGQSLPRSKIYQRGLLHFRTDHQKGASLKRAESMSPAEIRNEIARSGLRGRGGAGFSTAAKWQSCADQHSAIKYVICNADEGEPGTFKDRALFLESAHQIFEGMALAAKAVGASHGLIYLRAEYRYLVSELQKEITKFLASNPLGLLTLRIQIGAGAYVCGEESALLESLEGKRGEPRIKPPFPVEKGYLGFPTVVNNVETFVQASIIIEHGAAEFSKYGTSKSTGTRLLSISGDVAFPGIFEVAWGTSVREVLMLCGAKDPFFVQVGGPSGTAIGEVEFDRKISFEDLPTGGSLMVFSRSRPFFKILTHFMQFFVDESCGNCTPCRSGNVVLLELLKVFESRKARPSDLDALHNWSQIVSKNSRCGLGGSSPRVLTTAYAAFPKLFEERIKFKDNPLIYDFDIQEATSEYDAATKDNL